MPGELGDSLARGGGMRCIVAAAAAVLAVTRAPGLNRSRSRRW
jgi:hypothetical protein